MKHLLYFKTDEQIIFLNSTIKLSAFNDASPQLIFVNICSKLYVISSIENYLLLQSNVMDQKITILIAPLLKNSSCDNANSSTFLANLGALDVIQAFFIMTLTLAIVGANLVVIIVINCRRYASFIHPQVRKISDYKMIDTVLKNGYFTA